MDKTFKCSIIALAGCFLISFAFSLIYKWDNERTIYLGKANTFEQAADQYITIIDRTKVEENYFTIDGCVLLQGEDMVYINNRFVLIDQNGFVYGLNSVMVNRPSATEYFSDGYIYDNSGLSAKGKVKNLDAGNYQVGVVIFTKDEEQLLLPLENEVTL